MPGVNTLRYLESQVTSTSPHVLALVRLSGIELKSRKSRWQAAAVRSASVLVGLQLLVCEALSRVVGWARQS